MINTDDSHLCGRGLDYNQRQRAIQAAYPGQPWRALETGELRVVIGTGNGFALVDKRGHTTRPNPTRFAECFAPSVASINGLFWAGLRPGTHTIIGLHRAETLPVDEIPDLFRLWSDLGCEISLWQPQTLGDIFCSETGQ